MATEQQKYVLNRWDSTIFFVIDCSAMETGAAIRFSRTA